jgi:hypothetical protein
VSARVVGLMLLAFGTALCAGAYATPGEQLFQAALGGALVGVGAVLAARRAAP